jgi:hypothetical protein
MIKNIYYWHFQYVWGMVFYYGVGIMKINMRRNPYLHVQCCNTPFMKSFYVCDVYTICVQFSIVVWDHARHTERPW